MNIQTANLQSIDKNNYNFKSYATPVRLQPLKQDTVSFSGGEKVLTEWSNLVSNELVRNISKDSEKSLKDLLRLLRTDLKNLVKSESNPEGIIAPGLSGIKGRIKSPESIMQKAEAQKLYTKKEIETIGDIVAARISLVSGTQKDFDAVFDVLGEMVKKGDLKVKEIENYRLTRPQSFVSSKTLDKFEDICHEKGLNPTRKGQTIPNGYTATHLTVELADGKPAEIQILTKEMEITKDIEDFYYKLRCNKHFNPKYKTIEEIMRQHLDKLTPFQKETLDMYIKDSYLQALEQSKNPKLQRSHKKFIDFPYSLPQELSFTELSKMKERCDRIAKEQVKNKKA